MDTNRLKEGDMVRVIIDCDGRVVGNLEGRGFTDIATVIEAAYQAEGTSYPKEDCVFTVVDETTGTSERYRINAHGNVKLIV